MKILFAGPSLSGEIDTLAGVHPEIVFRPPAGCGDILRAVDEGAGAIGLIDGYFEERPSVWHKEILYALEQGVAIAGGASMGALRASECEAFGMVGIGSVFSDYAEGRLMDDEAVALAHAPQELGWMPLSVPWVDFEATVSGLSSAGLIDDNELRTMLLAGRFVHFSERTYRRVVLDCRCFEGNRKEQILSHIKRHKVERKRADARSVIDWLSAVESPAPKRNWTFAQTSHWDRLCTFVRQQTSSNA